ncbi:MAG: hypothetical protein J7455_13905 [Roseiflexus sp.]|jgi:hypothetical protein|nr:hypothetical protein [Roseiflexus sp.]MBO9365106.1 hypothetical protein [Roseiflexus sp.]MBO9382022.1 hypothetical protein [Roseiflexus sp.]MBO9387927.1 hypothetical protein [Roseiflexus sp.]
MQRLRYNPFLPDRMLPVWRQVRGALVLAGIGFVATAWFAGMPWVAILIGGSGMAIGSAYGWWRWATRQRPSARPTLFVVRHRYYSILRLLRAMEADLKRDIATVETLIRQVDMPGAPMNANPPAEPGRTVDIGKKEVADRRVT